jgi:hypothetical protein
VGIHNVSSFTNQQQLTAESPTSRNKTLHYCPRNFPGNEMSNLDYDISVAALNCWFFQVLLIKFSLSESAIM